MTTTPRRHRKRIDYSNNIQASFSECVDCGDLMAQYTYVGESDGKIVTVEYPKLVRCARCTATEFAGRGFAS